MPSVRTESQPMKAAAPVASAIPINTASHHGQPRLTPSVAAVPKIATM